MLTRPPTGRLLLLIRSHFSFFFGYLFCLIEIDSGEILRFSLIEFWISLVSFCIYNWYAADTSHKILVWRHNKGIPYDPLSYYKAFWVLQQVFFWRIIFTCFYSERNWFIYLLPCTSSQKMIDIICRGIGSRVASSTYGQRGICRRTLIFSWWNQSSMGYVSQF